MAEALALIGVAASVVQLADFGFKLSIRLFSFSEAVSKADKTIQSLSNEVSLTSAVLKELGSILQEEEARYVSKTAVEATQGTVQECFGVFDQLSSTLEKSMKGTREKDRGVTTRMRMTDKLKFPFLEPKIELLRSNLDRLKSSLTLMLQVLSYARDIARRKKDQESLAYQKVVIESLSKAEKKATEKYKTLKRLIQDSDAQPFHPTMFHRVPTSMSTSSQPPPYSQEEATVSSLSVDSIVYPNTLPVDNSKPHVGELILLFNLVQNILHHYINAVSSSVQYKAYMELRKAADSAHAVELDVLENSHGDAAFKISTEAARRASTLQGRLREVASGISYLVVNTGKRSHLVTPDSSQILRPASGMVRSTDDLEQPSSTETMPVDEIFETEWIRKAEEMPPSNIKFDRLRVTPPDHKDIGLDTVKQKVNKGRRTALSQSDKKLAHSMRRVSASKNSGSTRSHTRESKQPPRISTSCQHCVGQGFDCDGGLPLCGNCIQRGTENLCSYAAPFTPPGPAMLRKANDLYRPKTTAPSGVTPKDIMRRRQEREEARLKASELTSTTKIVEPSQADTAAIQAEVDEVKERLKELSTVLDRGERLDALADKTDNLAVSAAGFRRGADRVRPRSSWSSLFSLPDLGFLRRQTDNKPSETSWTFAPPVSSSSTVKVTYAPERPTQSTSDQPGAFPEVLLDGTEIGNSVHDQEEDDEEDIITNLLGIWTTLSPDTIAEAASLIQPDAADFISYDKKNFILKSQVTNDSDDEETRDTNPTARLENQPAKIDLDMDIHDAYDNNHDLKLDAFR